MAETIEFEPEQYFQNVKSNLKKAQDAKFQEQLEIINGQILTAKELGQKAFLNKLVFSHKTIIKEQTLLASGIDTYITREDALRFIRNVIPKNSVKIIELDRFPRAIPEHAQKATKKAQDLKLFDDFLVVFTDLTGNDFKTPSEQKFVERNRDPVIFGMFKHDRSGMKHDRLYYIDSWQDDYCDLDFPTMVEKMAKQGIKNPDKKIDVDVEYLGNIVNEVSEEIDKPKNVKSVKPLTLRQRLRVLWTGRLTTVRSMEFPYYE